MLNGEGTLLLVANAGSDEISLFTVEPDGLLLVAQAPSGGSTPTSIAVTASSHTSSTTASPGSPAFRCRTAASPRSRAPHGRSTAAADPAQIAFSPNGRTLVITERGTNSISAFTVDDRGYADGPATIASSGATPYGFDFAEDAVIVTEAFGGEIGAAAASSYSLAEPGRLAPVSASIGDTRSEVCWAAITNDGRFAYVTNFGDGTISSYAIGGDGSIELLEPVAGLDAQRREGHPRRGDQPRRALPVRDRCGRAAGLRVDGRRTTAGSRPWASSRASRPPSPGSRRASR